MKKINRGPRRRRIKEPYRVVQRDHRENQIIGNIEPWVQTKRNFTHNTKVAIL